MVIKKEEINKSIKDIKNLKIQGASNIAKAALKIYFSSKSKETKKKLLDSRPTEPMMRKILDLAEKTPDYKKILNHFKNAQDKINYFVYKSIKKDDIIFTHCHSTTVVKSLIYAKKKGKKFEVYNTETRPLFQGRKTARELRNAGIKVTMFVDSAFNIALLKKQGTKKANKIFLGADALNKKGIVNKIGSKVIASIAKDNKIPLYILADSWKFTKEKIIFEKRAQREIWNKAPKGITIKNPAFEFIEKKYLTGIISELGNLKYNEFLKKVKKQNIEEIMKIL